METQLSTNPDETDELLEAQAEIRHLRETTLILREELETKRFEKDSAVQQAILAIQTFGSPTTFDASTRSLDIGVKISEAVVIGSSGADTSPFSIQFSVE